MGGIPASTSSQHSVVVEQSASVREVLGSIPAAVLGSIPSFAETQTHTHIARVIGLLHMKTYGMICSESVPWRLKKL